MPKKLAKNISLDQVFVRMGQREKGDRDILWSIHADIRDLTSYFCATFQLDQREAEKLILRLMEHYLSGKTSNCLRKD